MSYTAINGMRSARYPLQGLGCCSSCTGMGGFSGSFPEAALLLLAAGGIMAGIGEALRPKVRANRRRRHRR